MSGCEAPGAFVLSSLRLCALLAALRRLAYTCLHRPPPPSPTVLRETAPCLGPVVAGWALLQALSPLHPQGVLGVHSPLHTREARASSRWLRAGVLGRDLGHGSRPAVGTVPTQALHRVDDPAGGPGTGSKHTHSFALGDTPTPWRGSLCPRLLPPQPLCSTAPHHSVVVAPPL